MRHPPRTLSIARGFTLIEVLVVLSIVGILTAVGAPSFRDAIERNAVAGHANTFMNSIRYARSEAIRSGTTVSMCRSDNPETSPGCSTGTGPITQGWATGWIIFIDRNNDGTLDTNDVLLRVQGPLTNSGAIGIGAAGTYVFQFRPTGLLSSGGQRMTFNTASTNNSLQRYVCVSFSGRARLVTDPTLLCASSGANAGT